MSNIDEKNFLILAEQRPGQVQFHNYNELKLILTEGLKKYTNIIYQPEQIDDAKSDLKALKSIKKKITDKRKELEDAYSAPYQDVKEKLNELVSLIDEPLKVIDKYMKHEEFNKKHSHIEIYAKQKASILGEFADNILQSPVFKNPKWDNATFKAKQWQDEINQKIEKAVNDIQTIQISGGKHTSALLARYFETLSIEGSKQFIDTIENNSESENDLIENNSSNQIKGYKVLKLTATEDQMANILNQLELMGIEVEEIEDGMPKLMNELTEPSFDSFVAFDIETTGTSGAANGDEEAGITEIGAVKVVNGKVVEKFDELANPGRKILPRISRITHITNEMIENAPNIDEVIKKFADFCGKDILVGHNIKSSDLHYIIKAAKKAGIPFENDFLDTYILAKKFKVEQQWEKLNLGYLASQYGIEHKEAHRAWSDAEVNVEVYYKLKELYSNSLN